MTCAIRFESAGHCSYQCTRNTKYVGVRGEFKAMGSDCEGNAIKATNDISLGFCK